MRDIMARALKQGDIVKSNSLCADVKRKVGRLRKAEPRKLLSIKLDSPHYTEIPFQLDQLYLVWFFPARTLYANKAMCFYHFISPHSAQRAVLCSRCSKRVNSLNVTSGNNKFIKYDYRSPSFSLCLHNISQTQNTE